jgi:MFS family permease
VSLLIMSWGGVTYPWISAPILGMAAVALVLLAGLAAQEFRASEPMLPPRLFANSVFNSGVLIASLGAAGMFGATFLLPLFFQLIRGADASTSGTLIVPFLAFNALGAYVSGRMSRWLGRSKVIVLCGLLVASVGFAVMAATAIGSPTALVLVQIAVVGMGIGVCMPASMMIAQNAVERRDLGTATAALLFLRSMGSAFGSTLVGAILANRFAEGLARAGVTAKIDLTALRGGDEMARQFDPAVRAVARTALAGGFQMAFLLCAILMAVAFLVCTRMRDLPLQSSGR